MKPEILIISPKIYPPTFAALQTSYTCHCFWEASDPKNFLESIAHRTKAAVTTGNAGCKVDMMNALPQLKIITCFGVGVDAIDLEAAKARGIQVTNTPDVLTDDVADLAIGLTLAVLRKIALGDRFVRSGAWLKGSMELGQKLSGKSLGIIGLGRIGLAVARRAEAFNLKISYYGPQKKSAVPYQYYPTLVELARCVDILIVTCPGGAQTEKIVNAEIISALGSKGVLINVSRGSVVDQEALVTALKSGHIAGAGLDVFVNEPNVPAELLAMDNVVLQPHQGSATHTTREAMGQCVIDNLAAFYSNKPLLTPFR
jgi:lactate dehydrogenase-like 2-hydroxyacid dehydrogenase